MALSTQYKIDTNDIQKAMEQMELKEAELLLRTLLTNQARRKSPNLTEREAHLLNEIYREPTLEFQHRFEELSLKRRNSQISPEEYEELLNLVEESEKFTVRRLESLADLSLLRQLTLLELMHQLGIKAPSIA